MNKSFGTNFPKKLQPGCNEQFASVWGGTDDENLGVIGFEIGDFYWALTINHNHKLTINLEKCLFYNFTLLM